MKSTVLTGALLLAGTIVHAQLSFLPQVGFEQSRTTLNYNSLAASGANGNLRAGLKMDYRLKGGHGPYVNVGTSPSPINFSFDNTGQLAKGIQQAKNNLQLRLEAGYQYTSKAIWFGKGKKAGNSNAVTEPTTETITQKKSCGSAAYKSSCSSKKIIRKAVLADNSLNMRLQPSLGVAYLPGANDEALKQTNNGFAYNATNWKTAIVPAMGFEFARDKQRLFTLTVFYTKPLGMEEESFTSATGNKAITTNLSPRASTWGLTAGVPFSFSKANVSKTKKTKTQCTKTTYKRCVRIQ